MAALFFGVFGCFGLSLAVIWFLTKMLDAQKVEAREQSFDSPALRTFAVVDLKPAGQWQELESEGLELGANRFDALLEHLRANGFATEPRVTEDWGELSVVGPYLLGFSPMADASGWLLFVEKEGNRALADSATTRSLLKTLHQGLVDMTGVTQVLWHKRERFRGAVTAEPTKQPISEP